MNKIIIQLITLIALMPISSPYLIAADNSVIAQGKELAFNRTKGNCLACHAIDDGELNGEFGPPLIDMKNRYPQKSALKDQIWDATNRNPATSMPPFGKHRMLTDEEIDKVVEYIYSL
jgi:sulfur-oxidizing protein SoxX